MKPMTEKNLRHRMAQQQFVQVLRAEIRSSLSGMFSLLLLLFLVISVLTKTPFAWLSRTGIAPGRWPRQPTFWLTAFPCVVLGLVLATHSLVVLGLFDEDAGFGPAVPPALIGPLGMSLLAAIVLCGLVFAARLRAWRNSKKPVKSLWIAPLFLGYLYLGMIAVTALFRVQLAQKILAGLT